MAICLVVSPAARARSQADMISPACLSSTFPYPLFDDACVANLKRLLCAALAARKWFSEHGPRKWFSEHGPPWAPPLPLSSAEREALEHGGRLHLVSHYAGSLRALDWNYKTHPPFADYACGLMAYQHTPDYLRNDPELLQEFPPRPLAGIDKGLGWNSPETIARYRHHLARAEQYWRDRGASEAALREMFDAEIASIASISQ